MSVGEVIDLVLKLDARLMEMYQTLLRNAVSQDLREMLQNLVDQERQAEITLMRSQSLS